MEEATAAKPQRIAPLQDGPFTISEDVSMHTIFADLNPAENISQIAERPSTGASAT